MAGHVESFSSSYYQPESPKIRIPKPSGSGLTLVIPSLKNLKAQKSAKENARAPTPTYYDVTPVPEKPKIQRPVKLKPLKEVLAKLIAQLKKKDDYAFFLHPVDVASIAGYADVVKRPMDLGTMAEKVARGRYRSLEDFADDLRLVTGNAKLFNPPGSIYHTEADKLEAWGLDHISRAAPMVIQYETDWNIDVEREDGEAPVDVVDEEDEAPAMDKERERSVSVLSQSQQPGPSTTRRGPRGPYKKPGQNPPGMSETLEPDGGLPGSKDGLGAFPAGSDWAKTMLALKRKGKRYKTKKERLRFEKEGPPMCADGSLDYSEMEDPFSVLSYFVPDGPSRPHLAPLFPTSTVTTLPPTHTPPSFPFLDYLGLALHASTSATNANTSVNASAHAHPPPPRRKHWVISRTATWRGKGKEREDDPSFPPSYESKGAAAIVDIPEWQTPREMHALDVGSYAVLQGELAQEMRRRGVVPLPVSISVPVPVAPAVAAVPISTSISTSFSTSASNGTPTPQLPFQQTEYTSSAWTQPQTPVSVSTPGTMSVPLTSIPASTSIPGTPAMGAGTSVPAFLAVNGTAPSAIMASASGGGAGGGGVIDPAVENTRMLEIVQERLDCAAVAQSDAVGASSSEEKGYWSTHRAVEAEAYIRDVVYGGVEGFAYVRSLAEFVDGRTFHEGAKDPDYESDEPSSVRYPGLGLPLAQWVELHVADWLTEGRHGLLRRTGTELARQSLVFGGAAAAASSGAVRGTGAKVDADMTMDNISAEGGGGGGTIASRVSAARHTHPHARMALAALQHIREHKIDMGALIRVPEELFLSEEEWVGKSAQARRRREAVQKMEVAAAARWGKAGAVADRGKDDEEEGDEEDDVDVAMEVEEPEQTRGGVDTGAATAGRSGGTLPAPVPPPVDEQEGPDEFREVLQYVADRLVELDRRNRGRVLSANQQQGTGVKSEEQPVDTPPASSATLAVNGDGHGDIEDATGALEDAAMRHLRLNLLALAKRAPLDTIARLPKDLVPEHIRNLVPTLGP